MQHTGRVPGDENNLPTSTRALLEAVTAISSDLDLHAVLERIVQAATACALDQGFSLSRLTIEIEGICARCSAQATPLQKRAAR